MGVDVSHGDRPCPRPSPPESRSQRMGMGNGSYEIPSRLRPRKLLRTPSAILTGGFASANMLLT